MISINPKIEPKVMVYKNSEDLSQVLKRVDHYQHWAEKRVRLWGLGPVSSPIHWAVLLCDLAVLKYLIKRGADVNAKASGGETALTLVVKSTSFAGSWMDRSDIVKILLGANADITVLTWPSWFAFDIWKIRIDAISTMIQRDAALIDEGRQNRVSNYQGWSLERAARENKNDIARGLIFQIAQPFKLEQERAKVEAAKRLKAEQERAKVEAAKRLKAEQERANIEAEKRRRAEQERARIAREKRERAKQERLRVELERQKKRDDAIASLKEQLELGGDHYMKIQEFFDTRYRDAEFISTDDLEALKISIVNDHFDGTIEPKYDK